MADALLSVNKRKTAQSEKAKPEQVMNNSGGYTFKVSLEDRFQRFLILGVDGNTYYQSAVELAKENSSVAFEMAQQYPELMSAMIYEVSTKGRAAKQQATLFSLAVLMSESPAHASAIFNDVVRTATHLFTFLNYVQNLRGWGRSLRNTVASWYTEKSADDVAYQAVKYRSRAGWTHRDVLRKSHPSTADSELDGVFEWITQGKLSEALPEVIIGFLQANGESLSEEAYADLVSWYKLSWEMLPDEARKYVKVWEAILENGFPMTALIRQLPTLTRIGFFKNKSNVTKVVKRITDTEALHKSRIHPISILLAMKTYSSGQSVRGTSTWTPVTKIVDALDEAFYAAFDNVESTGKRTLIALDVSGSMGAYTDASGIITAREASAAMALVTLKTEEDVDVVGFTSGQGGWNSFRQVEGAKAVTPLNISARQRLDDVVHTVSRLPFGGTDCAAPMLYALENNLEYDTFIVWTDCETWQGSVHPFQALKQYREKTGIDAKLVVAAVTPTDFSIADPSDPGMLDISGFDSAVPNLIADFSAGKI